VAVISVAGVVEKISFAFLTYAGVKECQKSPHHPRTVRTPREKYLEVVIDIRREIKKKKGGVSRWSFVNEGKGKKVYQGKQQQETNHTIGREQTTHWGF
jgi:hypothetical protein